MSFVDISGILKLILLLIYILKSRFIAFHRNPIENVTRLRLNSMMIVGGNKQKTEY